MAPLMGARSWQWFTPSYGDYVRTGRGQQRAFEKRQFARELFPEGELEVSTDVWRDCLHGCDGECLIYGGPHECGYTCHPGRLLTAADVDRAVRVAMSS
ncbi:hypothetical protein ACFWYW_59170 [Nonomuraea sp. NPDC059023]|uniref:hypothetical protein n=1 Tax=unclassified Nonomuraea TaxID=2593643 RepID=UPI0036921BE6